jgi:hypothetical protein
LREVVVTLKDGIKETELHKGVRPSAVDNTIQNGIKETEQEPLQRTWKVDNVIKETNPIEHDRTGYHGYFNQERGTRKPLDTVQDVIKNGIKETQPHFLQITNPNNFELTIIECKRMNEVNDVLEKGIKETRAMDEWVNTENIINKVINGGIKKTNWRKVDNHQTYVDHIVN